MLAAFIKGARRELAIYDQKIQDPVMIKLLRERAAKGVTVRVIGKLKGTNGDLQVRPMKPMRLHVRAIIRDGTRAFVGSQSLRKVELDARREVGLLISNPTVTRQLMSVFENDWAESVTPKDLKKEEKKEPKKDEKKEEKDIEKNAQKPDDKKDEKKDEKKAEKKEEKKEEKNDKKDKDEKKRDEKEEKKADA
jgi:phosphatidylserine/phosphatidylglycerophosphate/cardiolipin synthase-like enzyme